MKCLLVYAHPEPGSFSGALKDVAVSTLQTQGHAVVLSDLYQMHWQAALGPQDFQVRADPAYLDLSREQEHAFATHGHSADVAAEQAKVASADLVLFQFPIWWFSMPAILKGWVDRVFSRGFAYSAGRKYDRGHFKGKRAMLCLTTGTASTLYEPGGIDGDLHHVLWPIHNGILAYTGFTVLPPFAAWMPGKVSAGIREQYLIEYAQQLSCLESTQPLFFHPTTDYDESQRLKPGIKARSGVQWNPRAGQNFELAASDETDPIPSPSQNDLPL
ncbi:MAG: NAD(P)H-dependent oxidoreductase [Burkholderiaceae bacterium]